MEKREILRQIVDTYAQGNQSRFSKMCGLSGGTINMWLKRNRFDVDILLKYCPHLNSQFLVDGEGPVVLREDAKIDKDPEHVDKITLATNELLLACSELKKQITDIRHELEEERKQHQATLSLLNRVLDLYTKRMDSDYIQRAEDRYRSMAAETEIETSKPKAV